MQSRITFDTQLKIALSSEVTRDLIGLELLVLIDNFALAIKCSVMGTSNASRKGERRALQVSLSCFVFTIRT